MRRTLAAAVAVVALGGVLAACGDDDDSSSSDTTTTEASEGATTTAPAAGATVAVATADVGDVLVDAEGRSLYLFTNDQGTTSSCTGGCAETWPPLTADGDATAGEGVDQALLEVVGGQVVYNGHPLYTFSGDAAAGETNGQGVGGVWYLVSPAGDAIM